MRVTYNFHLPVIFTARDDVSIATYGLVASPVEEDPELDTIESVSQRAARRNYVGILSPRKSSILCCGPARQDRLRGMGFLSCYHVTAF